jgi:hypothetical protein
MTNITKCNVIFLFNVTDSQEALVYISEADIHAVAGTLKQYFRELPDPLFTANLYPEFTQALGNGSCFGWHLQSKICRSKSYNMRNL